MYVTVLGGNNKLLAQLSVLSRESLIGLNMQSMLRPHLAMLKPLRCIMDGKRDREGVVGQAAV